MKYESAERILTLDTEVTFTVNASELSLLGQAISLAESFSLPASVQDELVGLKQAVWKAQQVVRMRMLDTKPERRVMP